MIFYAVKLTIFGIFIVESFSVYNVENLLRKDLNIIHVEPDDIIS